MKKPEKYLKPILDALTGCLTAIQTSEVRSQIVEPELFASTLLLVNLAKAVREADVWAELQQTEPNPSLKQVSSQIGQSAQLSSIAKLTVTTIQALSRLYLLGIRSVLPLCPEAGHLFSSAGRVGMPAIPTGDLRMILLVSLIYQITSCIADLTSEGCCRNRLSY